MKKYLYIGAALLLVIGVIGFSGYPPQRTQAATFSLAQAGVTATKTGTPATYTVTFGSAVTAKNEIICVITSDSGPGEITAVTDTGLNVFTQDFEQDSGTPRAVTIWSAPVVTGGSDTVTITRNIVSSNASAASCQEWAFGGSGTLTKDITKGNAATSASLTTGASSATTVANELVIVGSVTTSTNTTCTAGSGYSNVTFVALSNANNCMESAEVSVTGAQTGTMTWTTSRAYAAALVTYYVSGATPPAGGGGVSQATLLFGDW